MIDQLNPIVVQIIRSVWQGLWSAILSVAFVADFMESAGLEPGAAEAVAFPIVLGLFILAGRALERLHPAFGWMFNGIHRSPEYTAPDA